MRKRGRRVGIGARIVRIVDKCRRDRLLGTILAGQLSNIEGRGIGRHEGLCHLHQIVVLLTVEPVAVGGFREEREEHLHILGVLRHLNADTFFVDITVQIAVIGLHILQNCSFVAGKINNLRV